MCMRTCVCVSVRVVVAIVVVVDEEHGQRYTYKRISWREARRSKNIINIVTNVCDLQSTDEKTVTNEETQFLDDSKSKFHMSLWRYQI